MRLVQSVVFAAICLGTLGSGGAPAAEKVAILDGKNGPVGQCLLPPGRWLLNFERDYASKRADDKSAVVKTRLMTGNFVLNVACDGEVKLISPAASAVDIFDSVFTSAGWVIQPIPASRVETKPVTLFADPKLALADDGNPVVSVTATIKDQAPQVWSFHVIRNESPDAPSWLSGNEPWNGTSFAGAPESGPADPSLQAAGQYRRFSEEELNLIMRDSPFPDQPDGTTGFPHAGDPPNTEDAQRDGFTMVPVGPMPQISLGLEPTLVEDFVEHTGPLDNTYTTVKLDWHGQTPGTVKFTLSDGKTVSQSKPGEPAGAEYTASFNIGDLGAGLYTVVAEATTAGVTQASNIVNLKILPKPAWAADAGLAVEGTTACGSGLECVQYSASKTLDWPDGSVKVPHFSIPASVPVIGGEWGLEPMHFTLKAMPRSWPQDAADEGPVDGSGKFAIAGKGFTFTVRPDRSGIDTRTHDLPNDPGGLEFVTGKVAGTSLPSLAQFEDPDVATLQKDVGLADVIPGLTSLLASIPVGGKTVAAHLPNVVQATVNLGVSGGVAFGVPHDKIEIVDGQLTFEPQLTLEVGLLTDIGSATVNGSLGGHVTVPIGSDSPVQCDLSYAFYLHATFAGYEGFYPSPPSFTPLTKCDEEKSAARGRLPSWLMRNEMDGPTVRVADTAPAVPVALTLMIPDRDGWVAPGYDVAVGDDKTVLVTNATAYVVHPAVAVQDGAEAVAFTAEDPQQPRPRAFQIMLQLMRDGKWSAPIAVSDGDHADSAPTVAFDKAGNIVVAYEEMPADAGKTLDAATARSVEIIAARVDAKTMTVTRRAMTRDERADWEPSLARAADGTIWLGWRTAEPAGEAGFEFAASPWDGASWGAPQIGPATSGLGLWQLAGGDSSHAAIAETGGGKIVLHALSDGHWADRLLVSGAKSGGGLAVGYEDGAPVVLWNDGLGVVESKSGAAVGTILAGNWLPVELAAASPQPELLLRKGSALAMLPLGDQQPVVLGLVPAKPDELSAAWNGDGWDVVSLARKAGNLTNADIEARIFN